MSEVMDCGNLFDELSGADPREELTRAGSPFALATALSLLAQIEQVPLMLLRYSGTNLAIQLPLDKIPERAQEIFGRERPRYLAFRQRILDLQLLATRTRVDADAIHGLQRLARLEIGTWAANPFYQLRHVLGDQVEAAGLTRETAIELDRELTGQKKNDFPCSPGRARPPPELRISSSHWAPAPRDHRPPAPAFGSHHTRPPPTEARTPACHFWTQSQKRTPGGLSGLRVNASGRYPR